MTLNKTRDRARLNRSMALNYIVEARYIVLFRITWLAHGLVQDNVIGPSAGGYSVRFSVRDLKFVIAASKLTVFRGKIGEL